MRIKRCRNAQRRSAAAEIIGSNEDLAVEILVLLPLKSVVRFKTVSKTWFSLISGPTFPPLWQQRQRHSHDPKISGLFFTCESRKQIKYIPLKDTDDVGKSKSLARFPNMYTVDIRIIHSCNGFLLLCLNPNTSLSRSYQVYNPTTKQSQTLPWPFSLATYPRDDPLYLAFDPSKSIHYKVVLLKRLRKNDGLYQIHVYSSETNAWGRPFGDHYSFSSVDLDNGVYCNGSIHWISFWTDEPSQYFDVDQERVFPMPSSPFPKIDGFWHFRESRGHLYLTGCSVFGTTFDIEVLEMERDYSKWSLKYRLNFNMMLNFVSQEMIAPRTMSVLGLIHGKDERDVFLVLFVGTNMIISYNIKDDTFKKFHDVVHHPGSSSQELRQFKSCRVYPYIETLLSV